MKKLFSIILFLAAAITLQAEVVWNDEPHNVGSWNSKQLAIGDYPMLSHASAGDMIVITVSAVEGNANILLQSQTSPDWTSLFSENNIQAGVYPFVLTSTEVELLHSTGLVVNGENFTFSKVEILYQTPFWAGSADGNSGWAQTPKMGKSTFANLVEGAYLGITVASVNTEASWHYYNLRAGSTYEDAQPVVDYTNPSVGTHIHTLTSANVTTLQTCAYIDLTAQNLEVTGLYTYSEHKYYMARNDDWSAVGYPLTESDGVWSCVISTTSYEWIEFKITRGTWLDGCNWGADYIDGDATQITINPNYGNVQFTGMTEDVRICWNPTTSKIWCEVADVTATVAGTESFFGSNWSETDDNNDMEVSDGVLYWTKSNFYVATATNIAFKVVINRNWDLAYGNSGQNYDATLNPGYHDVVITLNWKDKSVNITDLCYPKMMLAGNFNPTWDGEEMVYSHDDNKYSITKTIANAGVYAFKLIENATWRTDQYSGQMDRTNCTDWSFSNTNDANNTLLIDLPGDYTFTYTYEGKLLSITGFPTSFSRPASANYGSLCVPFDAELTNGRAFEITSREGDVVTITEPENIVAGHAYIIKAIDPAQPILISKKAEGDAVAEPVHDAYHYGVLGNTVTVTASYEAYVLMNNELRKVEDEGEVTVASTKAYFKLPASSLAPSALRIVEAENTSTDLSNVQEFEGANVQKFVENGKLYILREGVVYDVTGKVVR